MNETIRKPDADPLVAALLTWFVLGLGHLLTNGQQRKWIFTLVLGIIGSILCAFPGLFVWVLSTIDAYQTAERLKNGEEIGINEYSLPILYKIVKIIDSEATCKSA